MPNINWKFWQERFKLLVDKGDGTHAERVDIGDSATGYGDLTTDAWGVQKISMPFSLFHGMWTFDIPESMWFVFHNGTQVYDTATNVMSSGGVAKIVTDATVTRAKLESRECPRYQPNRGGLFSTALWMPNKTANAVRDFGAFTNDNGTFFRLKSDGRLYACLKSAGVVWYEQPIDTSALAGFNVEKSNIYDIQFQWRSAGNYSFYIGDPDSGVSKLVHKIDNLGKLTKASIENPALPIAFEVTGGPAEMHIGCADMTSENGALPVYQYESAFAELVSVNGTFAPVITVLNPPTVQGKTNTRTVQLARISVTCSKKAVFKVWITRDPTAFTGGTLQTINNGSFIQTDSPDKVTGAVRVTAVNTAKMRNITAIPVEAGITRYVDNPLRERITFPLVRGDYLVVTCNAATATADCVIEWGEAV